MKKTHVLYISQAIAPYTEETELSLKSRKIPQQIQELGNEIRTFMPRFGTINERRHQLHEVIRLSGMNLIIDEMDHPLIIKVASIQAARLQVYFIDNEDYFQRKAMLHDNNGKSFDDNDERAIFFCRGVLETVKKLGWTPDIIHCHGWMTSLIPLFVKTYYKDEPIFSNAKIVYSLYNNKFDQSLNKDLIKKTGCKIETTDNSTEIHDDPSYVNLNKHAINWADAVIFGEENVHKDICAHIEKVNKPTLGYQCIDDCAEAYAEFYEQVLEKEPVLAD